VINTVVAGLISIYVTTGSVVLVVIVAALISPLLAFASRGHRH